MKVMSIVWFNILPARFGGQKGITLLQEALGKQCDFVCLCSENNNPGAAKHFRARNELPSAKTQFANPSTWQRIQSIAAEEKPDVVIVEFPYHAWAAYRAALKTNSLLVLHLHNIESLRFRRLGRWWWRILYYYERWACRKADAVWVKGESDKAKAIKWLQCTPGKISIVPYGIEATPFRPKPEATKNVKTLLFAGTLDYEPNAEAVKAIYEQLAPLLDQYRLNYKIIICGRNRFPEFQWLRQLYHPSIEQVGEVDLIEPYFQQAHALINPVLTGGGIQTKNMDALAQHCDTITFRYGAEGLDLDVCGNKLKVIENGDWKAFADAVINLSTTPSPTPDAFFRKYSWNGIAHNVYTELKQLTA